MIPRPADPTPKARRTRSSLISAAETAIGRQGVRGVKVMTVCARAGVGRTSFYNYFDDIDALIGTVAGKAAQRFKVRFDALHAGIPRGPDRLEACLAMILETAIADAGEMLLLTALAHDVPEVSGLLEAEIVAELSAGPDRDAADTAALGRFLTTTILNLARQFAEGNIPAEDRQRHIAYLMRASRAE